VIKIKGNVQNNLVSPVGYPVKGRQGNNPKKIVLKHKKVHE
jgi:hypothetical protein